MAPVVANVLVGVGTLFYHTTAGTASAAVITEFGYTEDGVTMEYAPTVQDVEVEESTFPVKRVLTKEDVTITANLAEDLLANVENVLAGALTGGAGIVDLGGGAMRTMALRFYGNAPGGLHRTVYVPYANPVGAVGMPYKKGTKTMVPCQFKAFRGVAGADVVVITDA